MGIWREIILETLDVVLFIKRYCLTMYNLCSMHRRAQQGRPRISYLSMLLKEVGTNSKEELRTLMRDRDIWRGLSGVDWT